MHGCKLQAAWLHGCTRETRKIAKWPMVAGAALGAPLKSTSTGPRLACDRIRLCLMFVTWGFTPYITIPHHATHHRTAHHGDAYAMEVASLLKLSPRLLLLLPQWEMYSTSRLPGPLLSSPVCCYL